MVRDDKRDPERRWEGVLGEDGVTRWVDWELTKEDANNRGPTSSTARPVSVRMLPETLALLDAFATRFRLTRSGMLLRLIESGLAEGFHTLPQEVQEQVCGIAEMNAKKAGFDIQFGSVPAPQVYRVNEDGTKTLVKRERQDDDA